MSGSPAGNVCRVGHCEEPPLDGGPDPAVLQAQAATFHKLAGILDQRLAGRDWIASSGPTIADIVLAAPMHLHGWQQLPLDPHPTLRRWVCRLYTSDAAHE